MWSDFFHGIEGMCIGRQVTYQRWGNSEGCPDHTVPRGSQESLPPLPASLPPSTVGVSLSHFPGKVLPLEALGSTVGGSKPRQHSIISLSSRTTPSGKQKMRRDWSKSQDLEPGGKGRRRESLALDSLHPPCGLLMSEEHLEPEKNGTKAKDPRAWE